MPITPPVDRQRQPGLLDELIVGHGPAALPQHPLDDLDLGSIEPAAQRGDECVDVHPASLAPANANGLPSSSSAAAIPLGLYEEDRAGYGESFACGGA